VIDALLFDVVTIQRMTTSQSLSGEISATWPVLASGVRASIQNRSGSFRQHEYGKAKEANYRGFFKPGQDILVGDRVLMADGVTTYEVTFMSPNPGYIEVDLAFLVAP